MFNQLNTFWNNWKSSLITGGLLTFVLLLLWNANAFAQLQLALSNAYFITTQTSKSIVIVAIDDDSLAEYGRTPAEWSRALFGELAEIVAENGARVLAYDLIFSEASSDDEAFVQSLINARQSEARTRIILAGAGVQVNANPLSLDGFNQGLQYTSSLDPIPSLRDVADYVGYVNAIPDVDSRLRRQPSLIAIDNHLYFSFSLATFFAQRRLPSMAVEQVISSDDGFLHLTDQLTLPVDERGLWLQNYFGAPYLPGEQSTFPVISFHDVINGTFDPSLFSDTVVMVGLVDSLGATDQYLVPSSASGALMSGVEIQANAVETLLSGVPLVEQSSISQALMISGLTMISSLLFYRPRWYWKIALWFIFVIAFLVIAFLIFVTQRQVINLFYGLLAISLPVILTVGLEISREITRRRRTEFLLQSVVAISEQQLAIDRVMPLIASDIEKLVTDSGGFIWIYPSHKQTMPKEHRWRIPVADQSLTGLAQSAIKNHSAQSTGNQVAVPIIWQNTIQGILAIQSQHHITASQINLLEDLSMRLAPTIDNIILHRSIDQQNYLLELILSSSPASILVLDHTFKVLRSNVRFSQWVATDIGKISGTDFLELLGKRGVDDDHINELQANLNDGTPFEVQIRDDQQHILRLSAVPLIELGHWVMILTDITDLVQLNELKTQMIRMASHDLKNPLSRILGYSEIIAMSEQLDETNQRFIHNIMNAGDEINHIITDILDLEQLRSRSMELKPISFKNLVREIMLRHEPDKDRKQQTMSLDMIDAPITVMADYMRLGQAISNLINNAIKYTPDKGDIQIRIMLREPDIVQLEIQDNGYGIPETSQEKLFTEFYRVKTKATRGISGTGLGLSLVKSVVEAHDGRVWFKSTEGEGSTFYVQLPVVQPDTGIEV